MFASASVRRVGVLSTISAVIASGVHLFPFRTEKLSPTAPMVLGAQAPGRVGRRRIIFEGPRERPFGRSATRRNRGVPAAALPEADASRTALRDPPRRMGSRYRAARLQGSHGMR